ncbi:transketolase, chloroplastic-like [Cornus florida]|uniref:transketolase, chloroplastic-like n=1 Tax=Cornus florida TaxID=4283 RepID=UPI00289EA839|nr:transketolase, chloroplastic-like [Cornus florida]
MSALVKHKGKGKVDDAGSDEDRCMGAMQMLSSMAHDTKKGKVKKVAGVRYVDAQVGGKAVQALVDTSATHNFITPKEAQRLGLEMRKTEGWIKAVNSDEARVNRVCKEVELCMQGWKGKADFQVVEMDDHDMVLGLEFMDRNNVAPLPCFSALMILGGEEGNVTCMVQLMGRKENPEVAVNTMELVRTSHLPKGARTFGPRTYAQNWSLSDPVDATRGYSEKCLNKLAKVLPGLIGDSADLATSNKDYLHGYEDFQQPRSPWGRNIQYRVQEHAMAGISNGIALHGSGLIPFTATFLIFSDYMKNSIRLSALSYVGVIYIMTHDSIGLGEDGPTHQPVEQLAGLRAVPRLLVFRPGDGNETTRTYKVAVANRDVPSLIALSRQKVAANLEGTSVNAVEKGGYIISDNSGEDLPEIIMIGTGSKLCLCKGSAKMLRKEGRRVRVVSLVCWRLFDRQPKEYKELVLPSSVSKWMSIEAGSPLGWREYVGSGGVVVGVEEFGASGAYLDTFKKFGFTEENVTSIAKSLLSQ